MKPVIAIEALNPLQSIQVLHKVAEAANKASALEITDAVRSAVALNVITQMLIDHESLLATYAKEKTDNAKMKEESELKIKELTEQLEKLNPKK